MSEIRTELQRAVEAALASTSPSKAASPIGDPEQPAPRRRLPVIVAIAASVVAIAGLGLWALVGSDPVTVTTGPADEPANDAEVQPADRATSFTLDMPDRFIPSSPVPENRLMEQRPFVLHSRDDTSITADTSPKPMVSQLLQSWATEPVRGQVEEHLIIELSYVDELPDGFLEFYFDGYDISTASTEQPLVKRGPASDQGGFYADWFDGTHYVMFIADGMTRSEFDAAIDSFSTQT